MIDARVQTLLLRIVEEGRGTLSARSVDIRFSHAHAPTGSSVLQMLKQLESQQLVTREVGPGIPMDKWSITTSGRDWLAAHGDGPSRTSID
jgi:hypothetical protein